MFISKCVWLKVAVVHLSHALVYPHWWEHSAFDLCALEMYNGYLEYTRAVTSAGE